MSESRDVVRLSAFGAIAVLAAAIVQSLRHPARLWSPGLMGRVLAWSSHPIRTPYEGSADL